jgi:hypothetical protein
MPPDFSTWQAVVDLLVGGLVVGTALAVLSAVSRPD